MKFGLLLHPERGIDAVFDEARCADQQGFDSIWTFDHLMEFRGTPGPDLPLDSFTLMTALGAITTRTRLAWAMLNVSFRTPAVLAKKLRIDKSLAKNTLRSMSGSRAIRRSKGA